MDFVDFIKNNLSHVLPLLVAGLFGVVIIAERARALFLTYPLADTKAFFERVSELVMGGRMQEALALCDQRGDKPVVRIVRSALSRAHLPDDAVEQGLALMLAEQTRLIQKRTSFLATIANVATLLGLFGTIAGLISSFAAVAHADATQKSALLSAGISTAMNATMMGLAIAIPCMIAFSVLVNRANKIVGELEDSALKTVDILKLRYYAGETSAEDGLSGSHGKMVGDKGVAELRRRAA
jgi:biopolymer transport protein ExbB/TolQ